MRSTTPAPTTHRRSRRLAALALAAASLVGVVGLDASPASAAAPDAPRPVVAAGYHHYARIYWAPPAKAPDPAITSYTIQRTELGSEQVQAQWVKADTTPLVDTGLTPGTSYRYRIRANNADGSSSWAQTVAFTNPGRLDLFKFGSNPETFVKRQYQDFLGRQPSAFELATDVQALQFEQATPADIIEKVASNGTRRGQRHPIIRLYRAYFDRAPDHGGLDYWVAKRSSGTTNLNAIAAKFAGSSEFQNTYGKLTHGQFVDLIYSNLFDRPADPSGKAYWVKKLNEGMSRGNAMVQFSESNEYRNLSWGVVASADVLDEMLGDAGPAQDVELWGAHLQDGGSDQGQMGIAITLRNGY